MRWSHGTTPAPQTSLEADYEIAQNLGKVRMGEQWIFFPKFSGTSYLPYSEITRFWLRQEEVSAKMCCGRANFDQFHLMILDRQGQLHRGQIADRSKGLEALSRIAERNPSAKLGKSQE